MNIDCQWIDKNLEALSSGTLRHEDQQSAQRHIENCDVCSKEVAALHSIDPLVKRYFQSALRRTEHGFPHKASTARLVTISSVAVLVAGLLLAVALRLSDSGANLSSAVSPRTASSELQPAEAVRSPKITDGTTTVERAKPVDSTPDTLVQTPHVAGAADSNTPDFMVIDPAGYSRTLSDYRGYVFVLAIVRSDEHPVITDFERLYKQFGSNRKFRFLAVSSDRQVRIPNTTFPIAYNQGSKLFGALPGDFVLLDEAGAVRLHGSLVKDFDRLEKTLQQK